MEAAAKSDDEGEVGWGQVDAEVEDEAEGGEDLDDVGLPLDGHMRVFDIFVENLVEEILDEGVVAVRDDILVNVQLGGPVDISETLGGTLDHQSQHYAQVGGIAFDRSVK